MYQTEVSIPAQANLGHSSGDGGTKLAPSNVRVLIIEDNVDDRNLLLLQLRKAGIHQNVRFIEDGIEAIGFLSSLPPANPFCDLIAIFLDLRLPSISGIDVLREIRQMERVKKVPVLVMTSSLDPHDCEECQNWGVSAFISKPITYPVFSRAIKSGSSLFQVGES